MRLRRKLVAGYKIMVKTAASIVILLAVFEGKGYGQSAARDSNAVQILARSAAALGLQRTPISSLGASGIYTQYAGGKSQSFSLRVLGAVPDRIRCEVDAPKGTALTVVKDGGGYRRYDGRTVPLNVSQAINKLIEYFPILIVERLLNKPDYRIEKPALLAVGGKDYHQIAVSQVALGLESTQFGEALEQISRGELFVDASTDLPVWFRFNESQRDWRISSPFDLVLSDYRDAGGVLIPMTVARFIEGVKVGEFRIKTVTLNPPVSESDFKE